jgi:polysaccharide pyruvyl transferase WcaK-like protein
MRRILILTQPLFTNYGGLLQAFALQRVVKSIMGEGNAEVVTDRVTLQNRRNLRYYISRVKALIKTIIKILLRRNQYKANYKIVSQHTDRFIDTHISNVTIPRLTARYINYYDTFLVGSDQVFRRAYSTVTEYFLRALKDRKDKRRIVYAASFGIENLSEWSRSEVLACRQLAPKFQAISVREDIGVDIFRYNFNLHAEHVLDPTMLLSQQDYLSIIEPEDEVKRQNLLMCYVLDKSEDKQNIIRTVADRLHLDILEVMPEEQLTSRTKDVSKCIFPSVSKWIAGFRDADFVVTDSFHGTVFSIIFNKPFICIGNKRRGLSRFTSLLTIFSLNKRLIFSSDELREDLFLPIDYSTVNQTLSEWQQKSIHYLEQNLK